MRTLALLLPILLGCGSKTDAPIASSGSAPPSASAGDDCQRFYDKLLPVLAKRFENESEGEGVTPAEREDLIKRCRAQIAKGPVPELNCVLVAPDDAAINACMDNSLGGSETKRQSEAEAMLDRLGKAAKEAFISDARFPVATIALTPAKPCCDENHDGKLRCAPEMANWGTPEWRALAFQLVEPHQFQYSYQSDGKTFVATAVGDLDCDGRSITYKLEGKDVNGNITLTLTEPPPNTD